MPTAHLARRATLTLTLALLLGSTAAPAAISGKVLVGAAPAAGAQVQLFPKGGLGWLTCAGRAEPDLARCACPGKGAELPRAVARAPAAVAHTTTGADGSFTFPGAVTEGTVTATSADGTQGAIASASGTPQLTLVPRKKVTVQLESKDGLDLRGAQVMAFDAAAQPVPLEKEADGSWQSAPVAGQLTVVAFAPGAFAVVGGAAEAPVTLTLQPAATLRGMVTLDGKPVKGAEVTVDPAGCPTTGRTDERGQFAIPARGDRPSEVQARSAGTLALMTANTSDSPRQLVLATPARLSLDVTQGRAPAADQPLRWAWESDLRTWHAAATDARGHLELELSREGTLIVTASGDRWVTDPVDFGLHAGKTTSGKLSLAQAGELTVEVVDGTGAPVTPYVVHGGRFPVVYIRSPRPGVRIGCGPTEVSPGAWRFGCMPPGEHEVAARGAGRGSAKARTGERARIAFAAQPLLSGKVVDDSGRPVPDAQVAAEQGGVVLASRTDASGAFRFSVEPGDWSLGVLDGNQLAKVVKVEQTSPPPVTLVLKGPRHTRGVVVTELGVPMPGAKLLVVDGAYYPAVAPPLEGVFDRARALGDPSHREATADAAGRFDLTGSDELVVWVTAKGYGGNTPLRVKAGDGVVLKPPRLLRVTGRVLDATGHPVPGAQAGDTAVAADGSFELWLDPGLNKVAFAAPGYVAEVKVLWPDKLDKPEKVVLRKAP